MRLKDCQQLSVRSPSSAVSGSFNQETNSERVGATARSTNPVTYLGLRRYRNDDDDLMSVVGAGY